MKELTDAGAAPQRITTDPAVVAHGAGRMLDLSQTCADLIPSLSTIDIRTAVSTLAGAQRLARAHERGVADTCELVDRLTEVLQGDADRLYQVASGLRAADEASMRRFRA